jgi:NTP pyrophosphatase (non-canonical NTP hydrolase)
MNIKEYQDNALKTNVSKNTITSEYTYYLLGLAGESGEVIEKFKKEFRNNKGKMNDEFKQSIKKELGDVLWYITAISDMLGFSLEDVAKENNKKTLSRLDRGLIKSEGDDR